MGTYSSQIYISRDLEYNNMAMTFYVYDVYVYMSF